jgi:hypothetical protein
MEVTKNVFLNLEEGNIVLKVDIKTMIIPVLNNLKADLEAGKIDPVKGTELDKMAIEAAIEMIEKYLV